MAARNETVGFQRVMGHRGDYDARHQRFLIIELVRGPYGEEWWLRVREQGVAKPNCLSRIILNTPKVYREDSPEDQKAKLAGEPSRHMISAAVEQYRYYDNLKYRNESGYGARRYKWSTTDEMGALVVLAKDNAGHDLTQWMLPSASERFTEDHRS